MIGKKIAVSLPAGTRNIIVLSTRLHYFTVTFSEVVLQSDHKVAGETPVVLAVSVARMDRFEEPLLAIEME